MRTRKIVVVVTGVAILFFSLLALDVRFREDDEGGGGETAPPGEPQAAELVTQPDLIRRSELDPAQAAADSATTLDQAMRAAPSEQQARPERQRAATDLRPPTGPLVSRPLPRTDSARGALVAGYPARVLRVLPAAQVRSSSVSSSRSAEQVSLTASTTASPEEVVAFYRQWLARFGFVETVARSAGDSTGWGFQRGRDSVVVTTTPRPEGCSFMLLGVLHAS